MSATANESNESDGKTIDSTPIDRFQGRYSFLSNFHLCLVRVGSSELLIPNAEIETYPSVEHAFQAAKTFDPEQRRKIREAGLPSQAKRLGGIRGCATLRRDWESVKEQVMLAVLRAKFSSENPRLVEQLRATGERPLIEGNTWGDVEWGCVRRDEAWFGKNKLGRALETVRREVSET